MTFSLPTEPTIPEITYFPGVARTEINKRHLTDEEKKAAVLLWQTHGMMDDLVSSQRVVQRNIESLLRSWGALKD